MPTSNPIEFPLFNVLNFDPNVEFILFLLFLFITLSFIVRSAANYSKFSSYGKILYILSFVPLLLLFIYLVQYGYCADEVGRIDKYFLQENIGSGTDNYFLIASCLLNVLAMYSRK